MFQYKTYFPSFSEASAAEGRQGSRAHGRGRGSDRQENLKATVNFYNSGLRWENIQIYQKWAYLYLITKSAGANFKGLNSAFNNKYLA